MGDYREGVQTPITIDIYATDGTPYTGTAPTLSVQKNRTGAPASALGTFSHAGSGLWVYTPSSGEVSAPCSQLHLKWSGTGVQAGGDVILFENHYTPAVATNINNAATRSLLALPAAAPDTDDGLTIKRRTDEIFAEAESAATNSANLIAMTEVQGGHRRFKANALEQAPTGGGGGGSAYGVPLIRCEVGSDGASHIAVISGDDKTVALWFVDDDRDPVATPTGGSAELLNAAGTTVGTATITDSKPAVGYFLVRLQVSGSPVKLRINLDGGDGYTYSHDIPVRSVS